MNKLDRLYSLPVPLILEYVCEPSCNESNCRHSQGCRRIRDLPAYKYRLQFERLRQQIAKTYFNSDDATVVAVCSVFALISGLIAMGGYELLYLLTAFLVATPAYLAREKLLQRRRMLESIGSGPQTKIFESLNRLGDLYHIEATGFNRRLQALQSSRQLVEYTGLELADPFIKQMTEQRQEIQDSIDAEQAHLQRCIDHDVRCGQLERFERLFGPGIAMRSEEVEFARELREKVEAEAGELGLSPPDRPEPQKLLKG